MKIVEVKVQINLLFNAQKRKNISFSNAKLGREKKVRTGKALVREGEEESG